MSGPAQPRRNADPRTTGSSSGPAEQSEPDGGGRQGMFEKHGWLIPGLTIAAVIAIFVAMVLLTWAASGGELFGG
jgi:hypothetical protein